MRNMNAPMRNTLEVQALPGHVNILNVSFDSVTLDESVDRVFAMVNSRSRGWICTVNVAMLVMMRADKRLQHFVDHASCTVADGQPLVGLSKRFRTPLPERVTGIDLVSKICSRAAVTGVGVYLLGSSADIVANVAKRLRDEHPGLTLMFNDGFFGDDEAPARALAVADSGAKVLIVAMGVPRQEHFIEDNWNLLGVDAAIGVGGSFDVLAGIRSRSPRWMQRLGLEWVHRMKQEPTRLFPRYARTGARFLVLALRSLMVPRYRSE